MSILTFVHFSLFFLFSDLRRCCSICITCHMFKFPMETFSSSRLVASTDTSENHVMLQDMLLE
ncbi:hypothetical protein PGB90_005389 [Kerria lacca]